MVRIVILDSSCGHCKAVKNGQKHGKIRGISPNLMIEHDDRILRVRTYLYRLSGTQLDTTHFRHD